MPGSRAPSHAPATCGCCILAAGPPSPRADDCRPGALTEHSRLLNLGQNRFAVQPQLGVVHDRGPWSSELTGSVSFFTDNHEFLVNQTREQDPVLLLQTHTVYAAPSGWWASIGATYDWGGRSTVAGVVKDDYREDLLYGVSAGLAINRQLSLQVAYVANRPQTTVGSRTDNLALGLSLRF